MFSHITNLQLHANENDHSFFPVSTKYDYVSTTLEHQRRESQMWFGFYNGPGLLPEILLRNPGLWAVKIMRPNLKIKPEAQYEMNT